MAEEYVYRGHQISIDEALDPPQVTIDGEPVPIVSRRGQQYHTVTIGFRLFPTLRQLAEAVVDRDYRIGLRR